MVDTPPDLPSAGAKQFWESVCAAHRNVRRRLHPPPGVVWSGIPPGGSIRQESEVLSAGVQRDAAAWFRPSLSAPLWKAPRFRGVTAKVARAVH
ncbi:unnamed protein product [Lota lota]